MKRIWLSLCALLLVTAGGLFAWWLSTEFEITLQSSSGGTLYCEKITVHPFQKVKIYISPEKRSTKYTLESITVNGEDCTAAVRLESLTLEHIWGDQVVEATFCVSEAPAAPASAVFVSLKKSPKSNNKAALPQEHGFFCAYLIKIMQENLPRQGFRKT